MEKRGSWGSNFGFLMAAIGSAVGLGNLWGFPYKLGANGGFAFLVIYLVLVASVGFIVIIAELAIGRRSGKTPVGAYTKFNKKFIFNGWLGVLAAFVILSFYSVLGGWSFKYLITYGLEIFGAGFNGLSSSAFFTNFTSDPVQVIGFTALFFIVCAVIVIFGVEKGIEKSSKIMMPALFVLLLVVIVRSVTLPGASAGLEFMFKPNFNFLTDGSFFKVIGAALAQMFFSLSLGMGAMMAYGSYLNKKSNIEKNAFIIPLCDTIIAILAGLAIMPAVFAFGIEPTAGPSLLFIVLTEVFTSMGAVGPFFGFAFYLLVVFAAITSGISLLEVTTSYFVDEKKMARKKSTIIAVIATFALSIFAALSFSSLSWVQLPILNGGLIFVDIFTFLDYVGEYLFMIVGTFFICIAVGWATPGGINAVIEEVEMGGVVFKTKKVWSFMIKFVTPILIFTIFLMTIIGIIGV